MLTTSQFEYDCIHPIQWDNPPRKPIKEMSWEELTEESYRIYENRIGPWSHWSMVRTV